MRSQLADLRRVPHRAIDYGPGQRAVLHRGRHQPADPRIIGAVLEHHRRWRTFRASLRALSSTDDVVHAARVASRSRQIETMTRLIRARNTRVPSRARMLAQLLIAEALCDAVAEGDAKSLDVHEEEIVRMLDESSRDLLTDQPNP